MNVKPILFGLLATWSCSEKREQGSEYPNIVIIYADDLGYGDVHVYNPDKGKIPTPYLDQFAREGMTFTDAHSSSAVCSPSRYTLLTGRYHWRSRLQRGIVDLYAPPLIAPERLTLGGLAKQSGYRTTCIGKWHLGWDWPIPEEKRDFFRSDEKNAKATDEHRKVWGEAFSQKIPGGPTAVGFDEYFGTDVPNWPPYCFIENNKTIGIPSEFGAACLFGKNQASLQGPSLHDWKLENILPALADRAIDFIQRMADSKQPFFLYLPLTSPHTPLAVNDEWKGRSGLGLYADLVMETDDVVGRVLAALDKSGISDNTIVVFTSDNGCAHYIGIPTLEEKGHYPSASFRGYKSDVWEGGHRVPFIVKWPGKVKPGTVSSRLVHQADIMATIAEILGISLPENAGEDSFSLLPLLTGVDKPVRENAVSTSISGMPAIRLGPWKLIMGSGSGGWSPGGVGEPVQLYNLEHDPGETNNLSGSMPDHVSEMRTLMEKIITDGRSNPGAKQENDVDVVRY
jgi:arylsulfatase A